MRRLLALAVLILHAAATGGVVGEEAGGDVVERRSPLVVVRSAGRTRFALGAPVLVDHLEAQDAGDRHRKVAITAVELTAGTGDSSGKEAASGGLPTAFDLVITAPDGRRIESGLRLNDVAPGALLRFPVELRITRESEGPFTAVVRATNGLGEVVFEGEYRFGYPRYTRISGFERIHEGAPIRDAFDGSSIDEKRWRIWLDDPEHARVEQRGGRLVIRVEGPGGYDGLVSKATMATRDVEAVCRAGVDAEAPSQHPALVHLCGSDRESPDNWFEVRLSTDGEARYQLSSSVSIPPSAHPGESVPPVRAPSTDGEGLILRIVSDPSARVVRGLVQVGSEWLQVGRALEVPARSSRLEIKTDGFRPGARATTLWFDDCRLYPRAATHDLTIKLQRREGGTPGVQGERAWPLVLHDESNEALTNREIVLRLYTLDGKTLVSEAHPGGDLEYATFSLEHAPWDVYPAGAIVKVFFGERQVGGDLAVPSEGVEGIYPDDVWLLTLE